MKFFHAKANYNDAKAVIVGCPSEAGLRAPRRGSRFGPNAVRKASRSWNPFMLSASGRLPPLHDLGNKPPKALTKTITRIAKDKKLPILLGGDHSLTVNALAGLKQAGVKNIRLLYFDAHPDMIKSRGHYFGSVVHEAVKQKLVSSVTIVGMRSPEKEELRNIKQEGKKVQVITAQDLKEKGIPSAVRKLNTIKGTSTYLSIDLDVVAPAFAPAVSTPVPFGLHPRELLQLCAGGIKNRKVVGMDFMEYTPKYDIQQRTGRLIVGMILELLSRV